MGAQDSLCRLRRDHRLFEIGAGEEIRTLDPNLGNGDGQIVRN
jgi:hypothetical protein